MAWPLALLALAWAFAAGAQAPSPLVTDAGDRLAVTLLTFGPGSIYWERFGHNAILIQADGEPEAVAFNYGIFDFGQQDFMLNFARGRMVYRMAADDLRDDLGLYSREGRWVQQQRLRLQPEQRARLRDFLVWNVQPENTRYRYDYFLSNCSTRVRDALDQALGGALRPQLQARGTPATYRSDAVRLIWPDHLLALGMDLGLGPDADRPLDLWQESFVPMVLMEALRQVRVKDADGSLQPLVVSDSRLVEGSISDPPAQPPGIALPCLLAGLALGALLWGLARLRRRRAARYAFAAAGALFCLACAAGGLTLAALWGLTEHWGGWRNQNLLLLNPLSLLLIPACIASARAAWRASRFALTAALLPPALAALALLPHLLPHLTSGPWSGQANLHWILLFLPAHLGLALGLRAAPVRA
ncbi:MAG: DUF4105 domain-containing protein [Nevskia sp.]|nr:DUF4105 domain-containing protein [Nevskia sp.]